MIKAVGEPVVTADCVIVTEPLNAIENFTVALLVTANRFPAVLVTPVEANVKSVPVEAADKADLKVAVLVVPVVFDPKKSMTIAAFEFIVRQMFPFSDINEYERVIVAFVPATGELEIVNVAAVESVEAATKL